MERKRKLFVAKAAVILATIPILLWAHEYGPDPGNCGVPNENGGGAAGLTCAQSSCHVGTANAAANKGSIAINFPSGLTYVPGVVQHLSVTITDATQSSWGFQLTARSAASASTMAGTFTSTQIASDNKPATQVLCVLPTNFQIYQPAPGCPANETLQFVEQTIDGFNDSRGHTGSYTYTFDWTPPAAGFGSVTFYVAANAATSAAPVVDHPNTNDHIYSTKYTLTPTSAYTCTNTTAPVISSIDSASAYGGYSYFASGSWLEIKGTNLADPADPRLTAATNPGQWTGADFTGSNAPTNLDGISVSINGKPAYVWYLSPGQLNVQAPEDATAGNVAITVTNCKATSAQFTFARQALAPGFLAPSNYTAGGTPYMVATLASDPTTYILNTTVGAGFGLKSRPAKPGELIIAYGVGFGDVTPSILPGVIVGQANALANPITVSFGSTGAGTLVYSGLAANFVGLYEFYITVPPTLANGDYQINVKQNGTAIPQTMYVTVHN